ncbi:MAG: class I SAM-dependent methyltransferase [Ignavibacteriae bacterium]|nr:MAG: class I SAM-dependent methyltransferase [Ignavibacteriota bacterium]
MGKPMDYNDYASTYAYSRFAVEWIVKPLVKTIDILPKGSNIAEIGCGTGNYIIALSGILPKNKYYGFDVSKKMLEEAKKRNSMVTFEVGNCEETFPYRSEYINFSFCVDVIHHIVALNNFFSESNRILSPKGKLVIVTDSEENMRRRSLTKFFPETLQIELDRYPKIEELNEHAGKNDFKLISHIISEREIELSSFLPKLVARCSSATRLIKEEDFKRGIERVKKAAENNEKWISSYSILTYEKE